MRALTGLSGILLVLCSVSACGAAGQPRLVQVAGRDGRRIVLNGSPFRFVGSNLYNAAGDPSIYECGPWMSAPEVDLDAWFAHARADYGATVIRFWAFQSYTAGGTNWQSFDRVMRLAKQHDLHVIPVLDNQWGECTQGGDKDAQWYRDGYRSPYGTYPLSYRDFVGRLVERYRDDDTVLAWSLMNEAESQTLSGVADPDALLAFTRDLSTYVKSIDPQHLLMLGVIGGNQPGVDAAAFRRLYELDTLDVLEYHDYLADDEPLPGLPGLPTTGPADALDFARLVPSATDRLAGVLNRAAELGKPVIVAEAGMSTCLPLRGGTVETPRSRAERFDAKLTAFFAAGGAGYLVWTWHPTDDCGVNFTPGDPLNQVLTKHAAQLAAETEQSSISP